MHNIDNNFFAHAWATMISNKAAADQPMTAEQSQVVTKNFSTVAWFKLLFGTVVDNQCTEKCM